MTIIWTACIGAGCAGFGYLIRVVEAAFSERERAGLAALAGRCERCGARKGAGQ